MAISHRDALELAEGKPGSTESRLAGLLGRAPIAIAYLEGKDHRYKFVNELYVRATGRVRESDLLGLPIHKALPELEGYRRYCTIADSFEGFERGVVDALRTDSALLHAERSEAMRSETWAQRVEEVGAHVARVAAIRGRGKGVNRA